jgi:hypothetical protein
LDLKEEGVRTVSFGLTPSRALSLWYVLTHGLPAALHAPAVFEMGLCAHRIVVPKRVKVRRVDSLRSVEKGRICRRH